MAKTAKAAAGAAPAPGAISLQGWDTANVVTHDVLNAAIKAQKTTPPNFSGSNKYNGSVQGNWGDWQMIADPTVTGGSVRFMCPIASGTGIDVTGASNDLAGAVVYVTIVLDAVASAAVNVTDKTAAAKQPAAAGPQVIKVSTSTSTTSPPVTVQSITPPLIEQCFLFLFKEWFTANIGSFAQVFHAAIINELADKDKFQWLKPTHLSYASVTNLNGDGFFSALCQTEGDDWTSNAHQIDVGIGENLPPGTNSVFVISGEKFAQHFLKAGAAATMKGASEADFDIVGDDLIVTNNKALVWQDMQLQDNTKISPLVPKGGFTCRVDEDQIELSFTGMTFSHPLMIGNDIFHLNFKQVVHIELGKNSAGAPVLVTTNKNPAATTPTEAPDIRDVQITVVPDQTAVDAQRVLDIISIAASVLSLGAFALGKWAISAAQAANTATEVRNAILAADTAINVTMDGSEVASTMDAATCGSGNLAAAAAFTSGGPPLLANYATFLFRFSMLAGVIGTITTVTSTINKLMTLADGSIDTDKVPAFDEFLDNALGVSAWPEVKTWTLKDVRLAESLLMYGELTT